MIRGTVTSSGEAVVPLRVRGANGSEVDIDAVIDTGYTGILTLPPAAITVLNLPWLYDGRVTLGDGTVRTVGVYDAEVEWDGSWRNVPVTEVDGTALIGMKLLAGHEVFIEVVPGGVVDITAMP